MLGIKQWIAIFLIVKENKGKSNILYPMKTSFNNEGGKDFFSHTKAERVYY